MQCPCSGCSAHGIVRELGCRDQASDAVYHKVNAVCCDGGCSAHEGGCSVPPVVAVTRNCPEMLMQCLYSGCSVSSVIAVCLQCLFSWVQCSYSGCRDPCPVSECGCSAHAVIAVYHKVDVVCCDGRCSSHGGGLSEPVLNAVLLQCDFSCMPCS